MTVAGADDRRGERLGLILRLGLGLFLVLVLANFAPERSAGAAAVAAGRAEIVAPDGATLSGGGSTTAFRVELPKGAACKGDSANAGYRVQGYVVPVSVDPATVTFDASGPVPAEGQFRATLYEATPSQHDFVNGLTAIAEPLGGPGPIVQPIPAFSFAAFDPKLGFAFVPGTYNVGVACTLGPPSATQQDRHWNAVMTIAADTSDPGPAKLHWTTATAARGATGAGNGSSSGRRTPMAVLVVAVFVCLGIAAAGLRRRATSPVRTHTTTSEPP